MAVSLPRGQLTSRAGRVLPIDTGAPGRRSLWSSGGSERPQQHPRVLVSGSAPCPGTGPGESATSIPAESSGKGAGAIDHSPTAPTDLRTVTSTRRTPSVLCLGAGTPPGPADLTAWVLRLFRPSIPRLPVHSYSRALEHSRCTRGRVPVPGIPDTRLLRLGRRQSQPFAPGGLLAQSGESDQAGPSKTHEGSSYRDLGDTRPLGTRTSEPTRPKVGGWGAHSQPLGMGGTTCVPARFPNPWMLLTRPQRHPPVAGSGRRPRAEERLRIHKTPCLRRIYRGPSFGNPCAVLEKQEEQARARSARQAPGGEPAFPARKRCHRTRAAERPVGIFVGWCHGRAQGQSLIPRRVSDGSRRWRQRAARPCPLALDPRNRRSNLEEAGGGGGGELAQAPRALGCWCPRTAEAPRACRRGPVCPPSEARARAPCPAHPVPERLPPPRPTVRESAPVCSWGLVSPHKARPIGGWGLPPWFHLCLEGPVPLRLAPRFLS